MTLQIKAQSAFGNVAVGALLTSTADIAAYLRGMYQEGGEATDLSDEQIVAIATATPFPEGYPDKDSSADDWEVEVMAAIEAGMDDDEPAGELADSLVGVSNKLANDATIQQWIDDIIIGQAKVDSGPVHIFERIMIDLTPQERAFIPLPGSKIGQGNNVDEYETTRINADGERKSAKGSRIKDLIARQPRVVAIQSLVDAIKAPQGAALSPLELGRKKDLNAEKSSAVRAYVRAFKVMHFADKVHDHKHITFEVKKDDAGKTVTSKYCLNLSNKHKNLDGGSFTVSAVINIKGLTADTTYPQLAAMMKRSKKKPAPTTGLRYEAKDIPIVVPTLVNALENNGIYAQYAALVKATTKEGLHELASLKRLEDIVNSIMDQPGVRARVNEAQALERASGNAMPKVA